MCIELNDEEIGRIVSALGQRVKGFEKSIAKFGDAFDPDKGYSLKEGLRKTNNIVRKLQNG